MQVVATRQQRTARDTPCAMALGVFDGMHRGHAAVIGAARDYADAHGLRLAVFTFAGGSKSGPALLLPQQKQQLLAAQGVQTCYAPAFEHFCTLAPEAFFTQMLMGEYNAKALFCGENFAFGAQRAGNTGTLRRLCAAHGLALTVVPMALFEGRPVSSSRIKAALAAGQLPAVNAMLGRPYEVDLPVTHGRHLGTTLGFPTANQQFPPGLAAPAFGVYITQAVVGGRAWPAATGWGTRPTVDDGPPSCETFIPGFEGDLYEAVLPVRFYEKIAEVRRFDSLNALAEAVRGWAGQAQGYFAPGGPGTGGGAP